MINFLRRTPLYPVLAGSLSPPPQFLYLAGVADLLSAARGSAQDCIQAISTAVDLATMPATLLKNASAERFLTSCTGSAVILHFLSQRS